MQRFLNSIANPGMRWLLRSPLHGVVSRSFALLTVTGRRSGRSYTIPVNYAVDGDDLIIISKADRTWWKNLHGGAAISVRLRGKEIAAWASLLPANDPAAVVALQRYYQRLFRQTLSREEATARLNETVVIRIEPSSVAEQATRISN